MISNAIDFTDLLFTSLLAGTMFAVTLMMRPASLDAATYVVQQQNAIRALNDIMPLLGALTIVLTLTAAYGAGENRVRMILLVAAAVALIAAGLITRLRNQPINAVVMTWSANAPPADWTTLRDEWWRWHLVRLACALTALALVIASALRRG
jgi:uncharacterized membrane protein